MFVCFVVPEKNPEANVRLVKTFLHVHILSQFSFPVFSYYIFHCLFFETIFTEPLMLIFTACVHVHPHLYVHVDKQGYEHPDRHLLFFFEAMSLRSVSHEGTFASA